jgi:hypothetical protein
MNRRKRNLYNLRNPYGHSPTIKPGKEYLPNYFIDTIFDLKNMIYSMNQIILNMISCVLKYVTIAPNYLYYLCRIAN